RRQQASNGAGRRGNSSKHLKSLVKAASAVELRAPCRRAPRNAISKRKRRSSAGDRRCRRQWSAEHGGRERPDRWCYQLQCLLRRWCRRPWLAAFLRRGFATLEARKTRILGLCERRDFLLSSERSRSSNIGALLYSLGFPLNFHPCAPLKCKRCASGPAEGE